MLKGSLFFKRISILFLIFPLFFSCVPLKKQMIVQDKSKKSISAKRKVDTTLFYPSFDYKLKPNDVISVNLISITKGEYDLSSLSQQGNLGGQQAGGSSSGYVVDDSGKVVLPVLGKMKIQGLNLHDAERVIQAKVNQLLDNTTVNLRLLSFYVYFIGETNKQGSIFAPRDRLTIIEAISLAGGFSDFANRESIKIIRNQNNTAHIYYINLLDQNLITKNEIYLLPNDIIVVEPLRAKIIKTYILPNITIIMSGLSLTITLLLSFSRFFN